MHPCFKNQYVQSGLVVTAAAVIFGSIALTGPENHKSLAQPVHVPHASPTDHVLPIFSANNSAIAEGVSNPAPPAASPSPSPITAPNSPTPSPSAPAGTRAPAAPAIPTVVVHVAGLVERPAVYTVPANYRVIDVVRLAGGARPEGDTDAVNLAAHLQDGEQIYIPLHSAVQTGAVLRQPVPAGRLPLVGPAAAMHRTRAGSVRSALPGGYPPRTQKLTDPSQGQVDLNSASPDELMKLPGIGPSTAAKIMDFRKTNGRFTTVDDVMNVKGIGPAKFAKMRPFLVAR